MLNNELRRCADPQTNANQREALEIRDDLLRVADPVVNAAVRAVGGLAHVALQGTDSEHERYTRPRFIKEYLRFAQYDEALPYSVVAPLQSRYTTEAEPRRIAVDYVQPTPRIEQQSEAHGIAAGLVDQFSIKRIAK